MLNLSCWDHFAQASPYSPQPVCCYRRSEAAAAFCIRFYTANYGDSRRVTASLHSWADKLMAKQTCMSLSMFLSSSLLAGILY